MQLSQHFTLEELTVTHQKLPNDPGPGEVYALTKLANNVLEPIRDLLGCPLKINSGYRSREVNKAVGGASNSQHMKGEAADIVPLCKDAITLELCFEAIRQSKIPYDQLVLEFGWIHVSTSVGGEPRREALIAHKNNGKISYEKIL